MKLTEILDKDKNKILTDLANAGSAEKAVRVLENVTDTLLLRYNEHCDSERARDTAAYLMQALRLSVQMIDSAGNTRVWESETQDKKSSRSSKSSGGITVPGALLIALGIVLAIYGMLPLIMAGLADSDAVTHRELIIRLAAVLAGIASAFAGGFLSRSTPGKISKEQHVEIRVDADKLYRYYRTAILSVDQSLEEIQARERWDNREQAGNIDGRPATTPEIDLFADLIAASYSGDPEYALEKIDEIKYFLHRQQIEVVDYSSSTQQYFDLMPGSKAGTIRPALIADGTLLRKGLASTGR